MKSMNISVRAKRGYIVCSRLAGPHRYMPVSRISRDGEIYSEEILDLGGNFGIPEEIFTDLERINSYILI